MKKLLTLVLALVMVFAIAAPAMAISGVTEDKEEDKETTTGDISLKVAIVEERDAGFAGAGYVDVTSKTFTKNERVYIGVSVEVPTEPKINEKFYEGSAITVETTNITMNKLVEGEGTVDDDEATLTFAVAPDAEATFIIDAYIDAAANGKITATLEGGENAGVDEMEVGKAYNVYKNTNSDEVTYTFTKEDNGYTVAKASGYALFFRINDDKECTEITLIDDDTLYVIRADYAGKLYFDGDEDIKEGDEGYTSLLNKYNTIMDYMGFKLNAGGELFDALFLNKLSFLKITATANVNVYGAAAGGTGSSELPPKTGDAASTFGFVMIALAIVATAAVAYRKVRA